MHNNCLVSSSNASSEDIPEGCLRSAPTDGQWLTSTTWEAQCQASWQIWRRNYKCGHSLKISSWQPESVKNYSRHGIADSPRQVRLDALPSSLLSHHGSIWTAGCGCFCIHIDTLDTPLLQLGTRPPGVIKQWMHSNRTGAYWKALPTHRGA